MVLCARERERVWSYIHILLALKEALAGRVQQHRALQEIERAEDQQVVLAVAALGHEAVQRANEAQADVPLKALLQLEELAKGRVVGELAEILARWRHARVVAVPVHRAVAARAVMSSSMTRRQADLRQQALDLSQALADFGAVVGGEVVKGEG